MKLPLKGVIPPMVTPLLDNKTLDINGLEKLVEFLISGGVHGLFVLGTTGEGPSLGLHLRKELIKRTAGMVDGRIPVLAGITDTSFDSSLELAEYAAGCGVDAVVIAPPYYIPITQEEMAYYIENLAPKLPLPFLMYDIPACTRLHMSVETIKVAKELGSIGIKDSSGDISFMYSLINEFSNEPMFSIITGSELLIPETILAGGTGAVAGGANMFPDLYVEFFNASANHDLVRIDHLKNFIIHLTDPIYEPTRQISRTIRGIKCALSVMNICSDNVAFPLRKLSAHERERIAASIAEFKNHIY